jgi:hypothetical protein
MRRMSSEIALSLALLMALLISVACSRQAAIETLDDPSPDNSQLPFERTPNRKGISPTATIRGLGIPAGTPVAVRLQTPLSSESAHPGDPFQAFLDEPIIIEGQVVVPRDSVVSGRVVAARPFDGLQHPGYLRLTLYAIAIGDNSQAVETTSRFVKGGPSSKSRPIPLIQNISRLDSPPIAAAPPTQDAEVQVGERFIFRLKETVPSPMDHPPSQMPVTPALNSGTERP